MTVYVFSLIVGAAGLLLMGLGGVRHGHAGARAGHHGGGHRAHMGGHRGAQAGAAHHSSAGRLLSGARGGISRVFWTLSSPRVVFTLLVGFGATGALLAPRVTGAALVGAALGGALVFELGIVGPLWRTLLRFGSQPALTLETTLFDDARAATGFDANGDGLVAVEVDGQVVQLLGTLRAEDRAAGLHVRAGDRLRVEAIDAGRNRCTVSYRDRGSAEDSS